MTWVHTVNPRWLYYISIEFPTYILFANASFSNWIWTKVSPISNLTSIFDLTTKLMTTLTECGEETHPPKESSLKKPTEYRVRPFVFIALFLLILLVKFYDPLGEMRKQCPRGSTWQTFHFNMWLRCKNRGFKNTNVDHTFWKGWV